MARPNSPFLALCLIASLAFASACADDSAISVNSNDRDENQYIPPSDLDAQAQLLHVSPECDVNSTTCARSIQVGDRMDLKVQLLNADDDPIENAFISYELVQTNGAVGSSISALRAVTDANGIATIEFSTADDDVSNNMGNAHVTAFVEDLDINSLEFSLGISTKGGGAYIIKYTHSGDTTLEQVNTRIFDPSVSCDEILGDYLMDGSLPTAISGLPSAAVFPNGDISQVIYPNVSNNESFTVLGLGSKQVGSQSVDVAYGCSDNNDPVLNGQDVTVEISLTDHLPHIGEIYHVNHRFDLTSALPPAVGTVVELISTLANNPAAFIFGCPDSNTICPPGGQYGIVDMLLDFDFLPSSITNTVETFQSGPLLGIAMDFLNDLLFGDPADPDSGILPSWVQTGAVAAGDITDMLQEFTVNGRMFFDEQPDIDLSGPQVVGILYEENNRQSWDSVVFKWSQGCPDQAPSCTNVTVSANNIGSGSDLIEGNFAAQLEGSNALRIERHSLSLHYGALILAAIEQVVLPRIFDNPAINSIDAMVNQLINCADLISGLGIGGSQTQSALTQMCHELLDNATDALRTYITGTFVADGDDYFQLQTPPASPCTIYQPTIYPGNNWPGHPRPFIESLGQDESGLRCDWSADIRFSAGGDPVSLAGTFQGTIAP